MIKISGIKANPDNPRVIRDAQFHKLVLNILKYPKFLEKRPIVHKDTIIQGGNMRFRALEHLIKLPTTEYNALIHNNKVDMDIHDLWNKVRKQKAVPETWIVSADDFNEEEVKAFMIIDNASFGEWDWEVLANEWNNDSLDGWGLKVPGEQLLDEVQTVSFEAKKKGATDDDHSVFEQVMLHSEKQVLIETLNQIKDEQKFDLLSDALMHLVKFYHNHK